MDWAGDWKVTGDQAVTRCIGPSSIRPRLALILGPSLPHPRAQKASFQGLTCLILGPTPSSP